MKKTAMMLALVLLAFSTLALAQALPAETIQRATEAALHIQKQFVDPAHFVLDAVTMVEAKHGTEVCYVFHSNSPFDFVGHGSKMGGNEEKKTADLDSKGKLRVLFSYQASRTRACCHQERYPVTDITKEVRAAGGFLPLS
jgi:hypothetical protein